MARRKVIKAEKALFVKVGTPTNAVNLYEWLRNQDFAVYDWDMAQEMGSFVVFGATYNKLRTALQEAKEFEVLEAPYKVKVTEVKEGRTAAASKKADRIPTTAEALRAMEGL